MEFVRTSAIADLVSRSNEFANASPFPHIYIDEFLDEATIDALHDEARAVLSNVDASNDITQKKKTACTDWAQFGPVTYKVIAYLNSSEFIAALEGITGIDGLFGDPWLEGGGIHLTARGGFLKMHTDFNWNAKLRADRRINALLYLNRHWQKGWGGELELATETGTERTRIAPRFNRLVIFNTNDRTLHGHPDPLAFPDDYPRASIAMYYYTTGANVPERTRSRTTTTRYVPRKGGDISLSSGTLRSRLGYLLRRFTPFG